MFEFAAKHKAIIKTHSGQDNSKPEDFLPFCNSYPEATLILAHLGYSTDEDKTHQVRAIEGGKHDNIFVDTSSSASIFPGLVEWAVSRIGAEKILFGTDALGRVSVRISRLYFLRRIKVGHGAHV